MPNKNFVNFHILISHSPSCLNRDDMGMQKTAIFGGTRRVRISSQSLKRAIRTSAYYEAEFGKPSERTKQLTLLRDKYRELLKDKFDESVIDTILMAVAGVKEIEDLTTETKGDKTKTKGTESGAVAAWSVHEIEKYCQLYTQLQTEHSDDKAFQKAWEKETKKDGFKKFNDAFQNSVDIALSGRMATSGIMTSIDAALAVAHVITTHTVDGDLDWFTAVDDLTQEAGETGSAHLDTQEFSAGVFYRYASLNLAQLQENLGEVSREKALEIAAHTLHMLATVIPEAKRNSTAADNPADFVCVALSDQPISLANAFEEPVKSKHGFLKPSIEQFIGYKERVYQGYELDDQVAFFSLHDTGQLQGQACTSLSKLESWLKQDGEV
ncbi:type I-E CRISPR-associated protein Cas7/Cse4/CasC [Methylomonas montana]|uniref:type I-E CRISPR-associated protein Cas7/Cse4/CasC n=1 Tax=Methylomonas montana TaxID=3058963 RepID=UPI00265945BF|nr:type I-E CRISPR-associated protein Cas7/Cse4/CasC [Methylomonas montana]WKJ90934.1 type I-E CRISPR-associated protein Cas7/Cse4/CasC [Methylomonas montana]